ncbi:Rid family hydrolase [Pseudooceanicola sp. MF1-13]|uniref:Rid family hydrolase n=1 Tax=Pseudooceanicola sp. MF1-13 TaxID=3379095 RepID=UPI003891F216
MNAITVIEPDSYPWLDYKKYAFALGKKTPAGLFLSGKTGSAYADGAVSTKGTMTDQAKLAWDKIERVLAAEGFDLSAITRVVEYVPIGSLEAYEEAVAVRQNVLGDREVCVNTVPVKALLRPDSLIEIEVTTDIAAEGLSKGIVHLPTIQPLKDGEIAYPGDVVGQTARIFEIADDMLTKMGLGLDHVVQTIDYLVPEVRRDYRASGKPRFDALGPVYPGAAGIMMPGLLHPDAVVQYDITASRDTPERIRVPGWDRYDNLSYSAGVKAGKFIFGSGFGPLNPATDECFHDYDVVAQADMIYASIQTMLAVAGAKMADVVHTLEFVEAQTLDEYKAVADVRRKYFGKTLPAATGVVCEGILKRSFVIEIVPIALISE